MTQPDRQTRHLDHVREYVWIVTVYHTACCECEEDLPPGSRILWKPAQPRGKNNWCAPCGTEEVGSYPPSRYWERRQSDFEDRQGANRRVDVD